MPDKESGAVYGVVVEQAAEQPLAVAKDRAPALRLLAERRLTSVKGRPIYVGDLCFNAAIMRSMAL